ncbi:MAG: PQQ-like beta-propeller repeat protein [Akkermansiaceae bacterium]|nr:PQQ-like beta-propeller repeat protein [Akkermansiaceae bacterium]
MPGAGQQAWWIGVVLVAAVVGSMVWNRSADLPEAGPGDSPPAAGPAASWPQWRGPLGNGVAPGARPPLAWSETENVRWKTPLPGRGMSSPVVWGDHIFLTTAVAHGEEVDPPAGRRPGEHDNLVKVRRNQLMVVAVRRDDGRIAWQRTVRDVLPHESRHLTASFASASPVTDGERVFAFFGSHGLYCLDTAGEVLWEKDLGDMHTKHAHGEGSSPALSGDILVVNWDHEGDDFVVGLDKRTGDERWRRERDEPTSWSSPQVFVHDGQAQAVIAATNRTRAYDPATGEVLWECGGLSHNVVASPVYENGILIVGSSYETRAIMGIRLDGATGDLTGTGHVAWIKRRDTPYVPSLLLYQNRVYYFRHYQGILTCRHAATGEVVYERARLPGIGNVYASPVAADGRIYITGMDGLTVVIRAGDDPTVLAQNQLDDSFSASAAIVGDELILRGERSLYCLGEP